MQIWNAQNGRSQICMRESIMAAVGNKSNNLSHLLIYPLSTAADAATLWYYICLPQTQLKVLLLRLGSVTPYQNVTV